MKYMPIAALLSIAIAATGCSNPEATQKIAQAQSDASLQDHSKEFTPRIEEVVPGIHLAIGYGLANSILIEGDDGVIIVDAMESMPAGKRVKEAFNKITTKPVKAIIYTHNHADHIFGAKALAGNDNPEIYAHATTSHHIDKIINVLRPIIFTRSMRQFGSLLPEGGVENCGIGPYLDVNRSTEAGLIRPTQTFDTDNMKVTIAGVDIELVFAPGETPDQIFVWLPKQKVLLPGDNIYKSFPNLYAIRGTSYRDVMDWVRSIDKMRERKPAVLIPSHTGAVKGEAEIETMLQNYRDAIQYVHDQTVRGINLGQTPDELVESVRLPDALATLPYLQEFYGSVEWSVRSIFSGYLGWFSGDAADLHPVTGSDRSNHFAKLAGGADALEKAAQDALQSGNHRWAVELAKELSRLEGKRDVAAKILEQGFTKLAETSRSANGRNYFLTQAMEWAGTLDIGKQDVTTAPDDLIASMPIENFMQAMAVNLSADKALGKNTKLGIAFTDLEESYLIHVRNGVADIRVAPVEDETLKIATSSFSWKQLLSQRETLPGQMLKGGITVTGSKADLIEFLLMFQPD